MATLELAQTTTAMRQITPMPGAQEISFFKTSNFINVIKKEKTAVGNGENNILCGKFL